jgi:hypothetical protein
VAVPGERVIVPSATASGARSIIFSPFQFATDGTNMLRVRVWAFRLIPSAEQIPTFACVVRAVRGTGETTISRYTTISALDGTRNELFIQLEAGFLQSVHMLWEGAPVHTNPDLAYGTVDLVQGTRAGAQLVLGQLLGGYLGAGMGLTWPGSPITSHLEGAGMPHVFSIEPGLGFQVIFSFPPPLIVRVTGFFGVLSTSAAAGVRFPGFTTLEGTTRTAFYPSPAGAGPATITRYMWTQYAPHASVAMATPINVSGMPAYLMRPDTDVIKVETDNFAAGDNWGTARLSAQVYIEPL